MVFGPNFLEKRQIWVSEPHFGEVRGEAPPWLRPTGKPMVDFLFTLIELFSLSVMVPELWGDMCTARLFSQGVDLFAPKLYLQGRFPWTILGIRKLETLGYPIMKTTSFCVPSFWQYRSVTGRHTDRFAVAYTASAVRCKNVSKLLQVQLKSTLVLFFQIVQFINV